MIIKNHTIELKDTSASEMARFRQIMLGIWRQQIEDDKNSDKMLKYVESSNNYSDIKFVLVYEVIECIKRKIGDVYPNTSFSKLIDGPINSTPEKLGIINYNDSQGAQKQGGISLEWNTFNGINLIAKTFKPSIEIGKYHTDFSLTILDNNLKEIAFKFIVQDFDLYIALFDLLGVVITSDAQIIINLYLKKIKEANNYPSKLDVIYESLPKTLFGKMIDEELYEHLEILLSDVSYLEVIAPTDLDTNEDKAILQILYAISDRQVLYLKLRYGDLLYRIYNKLHGEEVQDLLRFLTRLVAEFDTSKPSDIVYFDNSYYLFRDTHIKTDWSGGEILINNYRNETQTIVTYDKTYVPMELDSNMYSSPVEKVNISKQYLNKSFNPLAKLNFGTKLGDLGEQIGDENTFVIALKLHNMATKQSNWDLFNKATDLLSLLSAVGALRIVLAKGAPMAARALAGIVLAKDATHYAMLSNGTLEKWHENGYGWLANLWIAFSVTVDLASFGLPNLSKIAKEGNAAAELAETVEDTKEIKRVANEANRIVEAETGRDVSKMSDAEFNIFVKENSVLLETKQKVEKTAAYKKHSEQFRTKFHNHFDGELRLERASNRDPTLTWRGTGGHNHSVIGEKIIVRRYLTQPVNDMPFEALISVRNDTGDWIEKTAKSTMFPENWDIVEVKDEISLIYEKMIKSGKFEKLKNMRTPSYIDVNSSGSFQIKIEFDEFGNITNAYPWVR